VKSPAYAQIQSIINALPQAVPDVSGRILVRVPKSVHAALLKEAAAEGTSLNQLIVAKLCLGLQAASR
jgi:predicted HicB family RNase H-like nuclease